jgi:hypothetical protein
MLRSRTTALLATVLLASAPLAAYAQTCLGSPSFADGHLQLTGDVATNDAATAFGIGIGGGSESVFGAVEGGGVTYDGFDGATMVVGGRLGYQVPVTATGSAQICPVLGANLGFGPKDIDGLGTDFSSRGLTFGLSLGFNAMRGASVALVPAVSAGFVYSAGIYDGSGGSATETDTYGQAGFTLGLILNDRLAVRPSVSLPFGLEGADPVYGIGFTLNYGGRR